MRIKSNDKATASKIRTKPVQNTEVKEKKTYRKRLSFPLNLPEDGGLRVLLQEKLTEANISSNSKREFLLRQAKNDIGFAIDELKEIKSREEDFELNDFTYNERLEEISRILEQDFFYGNIFLDNLLEKKFKISVCEKEKTVILDLLLTMREGYSNLIDRILKNGKEDTNYLFTVNYIKELDTEKSRDLLLSVWVDGLNSKKSKNLIQGLVESFGEEFIIRTLEEDIDNFYVEEQSPDEDEELQGNIALIDGIYGEQEADKENTTSDPNEFESIISSIDEKQKLLFILLTNSQIDRREELFKLFNTSTSWDLTIRTLDHLAKSHKESKQKLEDFYLSIMKNKDVKPLYKAVAMNKYAYLKKEGSIEDIKNLILGSESAVLGYGFPITMLTFFGKEGKEAIKEVIYENIKNSKISPVLLALINLSKTVKKEENTSPDESPQIKQNARLILQSVFSSKYDITKHLQLSLDKEVGIAEDIHPEWVLYKENKTSFKELCLFIGIEKLASWIMYNRSENLRKNSRNFLEKALSEEIKDESKKEIEANFNTELIKFMRDKKLGQEFANWINALEPLKSVT